MAASSTPASGDFYFIQDGKESGPHVSSEIGPLTAAGTINPDTLVWLAGMEKWQPAATIGAFANAFRESARRLPPPVGETMPQAANSRSSQAAVVPTNSGVFEITLPLLGAKQKISMSDIRDPKEKLYLGVIWVVNVIVGLLLVAVLIEAPEFLLVLAIYGPMFVLFIWISSKLFQAWLLGHCVEVCPDQYPQIHSVVKQASEFLSISAPRIFVMQGHGMFELFVAKRFMRHGTLIMTSNMVDEFAKRPNSREFMMFVGRQLGHIKAGHFRWWFFKNIIGLGALFFYSAWKRHCHFTADRVGLLCAGDLYSAEQALLMITVGVGLAPGTNFGAIQRQREQLGASFWAWLGKIFSTYPYMIVRIVRLREFATALGLRAQAPNAAVTLGGLPIQHVSLRSLPVLVIHGHDRLALLELQNLLLTRFPNVVPRLMVSQQYGMLGMSEKFDRVAGDVWGAIALITPDDKGGSVQDETSASMRARQNVVMEVGWAWGKLGRQKCLLLKRGDVELPSDLAGADVETFQKTPIECIATVYAFIEHLTATRE